MATAASRAATRRASSGRFRLPERSPEKDTLDHFERFCYTLKLKDGAGRFKLDDWILDALADYFDGLFETLLLLPTGNGKSTLLGALALHHATYVRADPRVIVLGGQGKHARNTLDAASWFIGQSTDLSRWWEPQEYGQGRIKSLIDPASKGAGIHVFSTGGNGRKKGGGSVEGDEWTLLLVEELHRHEDNGGAVRTLTSKAQKRDTPETPTRIVHATTAGDNMQSPLGRLIDRVTERREGCVVETDRRPGEYYRYARDADGDTCMHEWALPEEVDGKPVDHTDMAEVKRANPARIVTEKSLRLSFKATSAEPWVFLRQHCNRWVLDDIAYFDKVDWKACRKDQLAIPPDVEGVFVGLDTASKWDSTGIVPVWIDPETGRPRTAGAVILKSPQDGKRRRMRDVIDVLEAMRQVWPSMRIVFDRNKGGGLIAEEFEEDHGLVVIDHDQGVDMEDASMLLAQLVDEHGIDHDGNPDLTEHMENAVARFSLHGTKSRIAQPTDRARKVDGAQALAMAVHIALDPPDEAAPLDPANFLPKRE
jgi:phage terminase large subunit-like protein